MLAEALASEDGILFVQNKTGVAIIIGWTEWLQDLIARCKEAAPQSLTIVATSTGLPWSTQGFKNAWQSFIRNRPDRFQFRDIRKKSGNDGESGAHLGNDSKTFEKWYRLKPRRAQGLSGREDAVVLDGVLDKNKNNVESFVT